MDSCKASLLVACVIRLAGSPRLIPANCGPMPCFEHDDEPLTAGGFAEGCKEPLYLQSRLFSNCLAKRAALAFYVRQRRFVAFLSSPQPFAVLGHLIMQSR